MINPTGRSTVNYTTSISRNRSMSSRSKSDLAVVVAVAEVDYIISARGIVTPWRASVVAWLGQAHFLEKECM